MVNFGQFWKKHFPSKNLLWDLFGQHLDKFGLLFIPTSGHTANRQGTYVLFGTTNTSRIEKFLSKSSDRLTIEMTKTTICYLPPPPIWTRTQSLRCIDHTERVYGDCMRVVIGQWGWVPKLKLAKVGVLNVHCKQMACVGFSVQFKYWCRTCISRTIGLCISLR